MRVGAGEPKRADSRDAGSSAARPGDALLHHLHWEPVPRNVRRRVLEVEVLGQGFMFQREDDLDDACDSRGGFQVPDVRLRRADQQRFAGFASGAVGRARGLGLDGVAQGCAGAVCFQVSNVAGVEIGAFERIGNHPLLSNTVGHRQAARRAILVDCTAADHGPNPVAVTNRVLESLHDDDTATLAAYVAVRGSVEGLAPAVGCEHLSIGERDHGRRRE